MNNYWAFLQMEPSNALLENPSALRARFIEDGFLYLRQVLDQGELLKLRRLILQVCESKGWVNGGPDLMDAHAIAMPTREGEEQYFEVYDELQKLEEFHALAHDPRLQHIMSSVLGGDVFPHPLKIARLIFPANYEISTPPHQDYLNNQGSPDLTASWIPLGDCPMELGGLAILKGSHKYGVMPLKFHLGAGNRTAVIPDEMQHLRWYTTDYSLGDMVLFPSMTMHASLHNASEFFMRLSVDYRYQREDEPITEICLQPHCGRVSWEEVYENWKSDEHKYYWKRHRYRIASYDRSSYENQELKPEDYRQYVIWKQRLENRMKKGGGIVDPE